jgi:hypothetical protein
MSSKQTILSGTGRGWKLPLTLALVVHLVVLALLIMPPSFLSNRHDFQEVQSITLFTPAELKPLKRRRVARPNPRPKPVAHKAKPLHPAVPPKLPPKSEKAISLKPRPLRKKPSQKLTHLAIAKLKARIKRQEEAQKVKEDISNLVKELHSMPPPVEKAEPVAAAANAGHAAGPQHQGPSQAVIDEAKRQYYAAVSRRLHDNWSLPEAQNWSPALEATIVIVIRRDGAVLRTFFEKKSTNIYFNQYVEKAVNDSKPMPAFPAGIDEAKMEIGLRFRPSGIF